MGRKNLWLLTNNSPYLGNGIREDSFLGRWIGSSVCSTKWWHCRWPWVTSTAQNTPFLNFWISFISLEWVKLESSELVYWLIVAVTSIRTTNRRKGHVTHFWGPFYLWNGWSCSILMWRLIMASKSVFLKRYSVEKYRSYNERLMWLSSSTNANHHGWHHLFEIFINHSSESIACIN